MCVHACLMCIYRHVCLCVSVHGCTLSIKRVCVHMCVEGQERLQDRPPTCGVYTRMHCLLSWTTSARSKLVQSIFMLNEVLFFKN
jgi:hypothetical protein